VMKKGQATDTALLPGSHFLPALRRRMVEEYPSTELAYRAGGADSVEETRSDRGHAFDKSGAANRFEHLDQVGPALTVTLGDKATATVHYTVRFVLQPERLRTVHERFGPNGLFGIVRDESSKVVLNTLADPDVGVDSLFSEARAACQDRLAAAVGEALDADGIKVTAFVLGAVDLGRTGEVVQATVRARHELDREQAEAATRLARALNDADLQEKLTSAGDVGWRYRETDLWRELVQRTGDLTVSLRSDPRSPLVEFVDDNNSGSDDGPEPEGPS
jgi:SPFH domain / Band 7 family